MRNLALLGALLGALAGAPGCTGDDDGAGTDTGSLNGQK
jgi:hypothetical protein